MYTGKLVFSQLMNHLPMHSFRRCVRRYRGEHWIKSFSCLDQYRCMALAQLTYRESLRDIEACLRAQNSKLYHMGLRGNVSRATLADANEKRDWRIHADFAQVLIRIARPLYGEDSFGVDLDETVYALDATTIDLCLTLFPWAPFQRSKAAIKLHTPLDLRGNIPAFIHITGARWHDSWVLDELTPETGVCLPSWIAVISTSTASIASTSRPPSSSSGGAPTSASAGSIPTPSIEPPA